MGSWRGCSVHPVAPGSSQWKMESSLETYPAGLPRPPVWRRLFHLTACSSIPLVGIFVGATPMVVLLSVLSGIALLVESIRLRVPGLNRRMLRYLKPLLKTEEDRELTGATYVALASLAAFLLFDESLAITALFFLALGDPVAALVGSRMGGIRMFGKSPFGTIAFFLVGFAAVGLLSAGGVVDFHWALVAGAAVAAVVELVPLVVDDNVSIPLVSGAAMSLMGA